MLSSTWCSVPEVQPVLLVERSVPSAVPIEQEAVFSRRPQADPVLSALSLVP